METEDLLVKLFETWESYKAGPQRFTTGRDRDAELEGHRLARKAEMARLFAQVLQQSKDV